MSEDGLWSELEVIPHFRPIYLFIKGISDVSSLYLS